MGDNGEGSSSQTPMEEEENSDDIITIRVKTLADQECTVQIKLSETVTVLNERIFEKLGIQPAEQRIIFQGRVLSADRTLSSYSLQDGYTVHLINRPPGSNDASLQAPTVTSNNDIMEMIGFGVGVDLAGPRMRMRQVNENLIRQSIGQIMPRLNNLTIAQSDANAGPTNAARRFTWRLFLEENAFTRDRENLEMFVRNAIRDLSFLRTEDQDRFTFTWRNNELRIDLPRMDPHIASPAFERFAMIDGNTRHLRVFNDIMEEPDGLLTIVRRIMEYCQTEFDGPDLTEDERDQLNERMREIVVRLESISSTLPSTRSLDNERVRSSNPSQREARFEQIAATPNSQSFVVRHALSSDLTQTVREFRRQQARFFEIESIFDEILEQSTISILRNRTGDRTDGSYLALSTFYIHVQRMRHHISHTLHIISEVEVPFVGTGDPRRLLPQYDLSRFNTSNAHVGAVIIVFRSPANSEQNVEQVSNVFSPPKIIPGADVGRMQPGQWPYLTYYPTGMLQEQHELDIYQQHEIRVGSITNRPSVTPNRRGPPVTISSTTRHSTRTISSPQSTTTTPTTPTTTTTPTTQRQDQSATNQESSSSSSSSVPQQYRSLRDRLMSYFGQDRSPRSTENVPSTSTPSLSSSLSMSSSMGSSASIGSTLSTSSNPSSSNTVVNPTTSSSATRAAALRDEIETTQGAIFRQINRQIAELRSFENFRYDVRTARGPETETLSAYPQLVPPSELSNIAQNIASRYRDEAITRIAAVLTNAFQDQAPSWDTRLTNVPIRTLRQMLAVALELLTMSGRNMEESREMMLALVRDESVLVRAIIESMKSLFLLGEFPTHVGRVIIQQQTTVGQRIDIESRDGSDSDEMDDVVVRMPSDVSQPRTGSLRDIADARRRRRQIVESRRNNQSERTTTRQPALSVGSGSSFGPLDQAAIDAGILPRLPDHEFEFPTLNQISMAFPSGMIMSNVPTTPGTNEPSSSTSTTQQRTPTGSASTTTSPNHPLDPPQPANVVLPAALRTPSPGSPSTSAGVPISPPRITRQSISIDPFLSCHNRNSEFNRTHPGTGDRARMTETSNDPAPTYPAFVRTLDIPERDTDAVVDDDDFTYSITRNRSGELRFENNEEGRIHFERVMRTAFRSVFGQLVESDAITALNSISSQGFPSPRSGVVQDIIERHFNNAGQDQPVQGAIQLVAVSTNIPDALLPPDLPPRPRSATGVRGQESPNDSWAARVLGPQGSISSSLPDVSNLAGALFQSTGLAPRNMRAPSEYLVETGPPLSPLEIASHAMRGLHTFLSAHEGTFPRGLFGLLCELLKNRIAQNDFANLFNIEHATRIIGNLQNVFRQHLIDNQMNGNARASREDIQSIAERLAADESWFEFFNQGDRDMFVIKIGDRVYSFGWTFRHVEIDTIRRLLELVLRKTEKDEFAKCVIETMQLHLRRTLSLFYWFYEMDFEGTREALRDHIPTWLRIISSSPDDAQTVQVVAGVQRLLPAWTDMFSDEASNEVAQFLERIQDAQSSSNRVTVEQSSSSTLGAGLVGSTNMRTSGSSSNSPSSSPSTRERCGDVEAVGETSAKRRKCDDDMDIDIGEDALENYDDDKDDKPTSSNPK